MKFSRTWWGERFIKALEEFTETGRLGRGRSYARNGKIKSYKLKNGKITAKVRGSVNPYFGVYTEPLYDTEIAIKPITASDWSKAITKIASSASMVSKLLMNEVPDNIEAGFSKLNLHLLPHSESDFTTSCSCPDWSNPCKHIAGVYYLVAAELDQDPFLLFELRGISREELKLQLAKTPLGEVLSSAMDAQEVAIEPVDSYYTPPETIEVDESLSYKEFWQGKKRLPSKVESVTPGAIAGILVKKAGDFPPFWHKDASFVEVMEDFYGRVRSKGSKFM